MLEEAYDERWPLLERLKFLAISETNLDEFFMIRVSGLLDQLSSEIVEPTDDGLLPADALARVRVAVQGMEARQISCLVNDLLPKLAAAGISVLTWTDLNDAQHEAASAHFRRNVLPVLTPLAVDPGHPFPFLSNLSLNLAVEVKNPETGETKFARVKVPQAMPRLLPLRELVEGKKKVRPEKAEYLLLESLIQANLAELFPGLEIVSSHLFRVTRDADIEIQEDEASDLLATIEQEVRRRRFGAVVRLEVAPKTPKRVRKLLQKQLEITENEVYEVDGPLGAGDLMSLTRLDRRELKDPPFSPAVPAVFNQPDTSVFAAIRAGDILLHHPYDSFSPVVEMIERASTDSKTVAIKMTLYRTNPDSAILPALIRAAENGKQVAVLVELKARFDEEKNIEWAKSLEQAGVHVVYGVVGLKTHGKIALVVRREKDEIRRYVHLGTGNYNETTARIYTDFGLMTCRPEFGEDATRLFNALTGFAGKTSYARLVTAPKDMHRAVLEWIARETAHARAGRPSGIRAKMNALVDPPVIAALYEASQAGVSDRSPRARHLLPEARRSGRLGDDSRALHRGPLPRAQPRVRLRERRRPQGLALLGRLDAAQLLPPGRDGFPRGGARARAAGRRRARHDAEGQRARAAPERGRDLRAPQARRGRDARRLAGRFSSRTRGAAFSRRSKLSSGAAPRRSRSPKNPSRPKPSSAPSEKARLRLGARALNPGRARGGSPRRAGAGAPADRCACALRPG